MGDRIPDELCDLVMKGGVTSGIVYPQLASKLSEHYRFKNIGGTSAGAIAAAACAAAELGRQSGRHRYAFDALRRLPYELGTAVDGQSRMLRLFQPAPQLRKPFALALAVVGAKDKGSAIAHGIFSTIHPKALTLLSVLSMLLAFAIATPFSFGTVLVKGLSALAVTALAAAASYWLAGRLARPMPAFADRLGLGATAGILALAVADFLLAREHLDRLLLLQLPGLGAAAVIALALGLRDFVGNLLRDLGKNFYGLCSGRTTTPDLGEGLTEWLGDYLTYLAGMNGDRPLTFRDLWGPNPDHVRDINLEMITTAVSQHTPYAIPFREGSGSFYFCEGEWTMLFPPVVMDWLQKVAPPGEYTMDDGAVRTLRKLPRNGDLPVIVGVRMSLSFPILLSAIPMYAADHSLRRAKNAPAILKRVWFSDGGLSSNLPLHFFDELLPSHPTFAINLKGEHPSHLIADKADCGKDGRVYLPNNNKEGRVRYWRAGADSGKGGLLQFVLGILDTMQSWRDESLFPYPGYRDRIVQVSLRQNEGGLNLTMTKDQILAMASAGACAGDLVYRRFHPGQGGAGWENHQRVRLLSMMGNLDRLARQTLAAKGTGDWNRAIKGLKRLKRYNDAEARLAQALLADLENMGLKITESKLSLQEKMMKPRPILRQAPHI